MSFIETDPRSFCLLYCSSVNYKLIRPYFHPTKSQITLKTSWSIVNGHIRNIIHLSTVQLAHGTLNHIHLLTIRYGTSLIKLFGYVATKVAVQHLPLLVIKIECNHVPLVHIDSLQVNVEASTLVIEQRYLTVINVHRSQELIHDALVQCPMIVMITTQGRW